MLVFIIIILMFQIPILAISSANCPTEKRIYFATFTRLTRTQFSFKIFPTRATHVSDHHLLYISLFKVFLKNGPIPASFCLFSSFSLYNFNNTNWKSIDGVLGTQTSGHMMVGTDDTTEVWWPPRFSKFKHANEIIENSVRGISLCFKKYSII